ncbi:MAG: GNAT family protein [Actinomycetes bacterium]
MPFTRQDAERVLAGDRLSVWAPDYPREGDVHVAGWIVEGVKDVTTAPWIAYTVIDDRAVDEWEVVGGAGFHRPPHDGVVEIGYGIAESRQGRGIATDAVSQLIDLARRAGDAHRIVATTALDNIASQRVLAKAGFTRGEDRSSDEGPEQYWFLDL